MGAEDDGETMEMQPPQGCALVSECPAVSLAQPVTHSLDAALLSQVGGRICESNWRLLKVG